VAFWISKVDRPVQADQNSGLHFCFAAPTPESVEAFHAAAIATGGRDNGSQACEPSMIPTIMPPSLPTPMATA
jgi:hypothetical protein